MIGSTNTHPGTVPAPPALPIPMPPRILPPWPGAAPAPVPRPQRAQYYRDIASDINTLIQEFIANNTLTVPRSERVQAIANIIRPHLALVQARELKEELTELFTREDWARGDRPSHAYVGVIWDALRTLNLWN